MARRIKEKSKLERRTVEGTVVNSKQMFPTVLFPLIKHWSNHFLTDPVVLLYQRRDEAGSGGTHL
jgi:hypothetical protein